LATYKYHLTALGQQVVALGLKLKEIHIIPALCAEPTAETPAQFGQNLFGISTKSTWVVCQVE